MPLVYYAFDLDRIRLGDILLTRLDFSVLNPATYPSGAIQLKTKSRFSHAALCIGYGQFIEAIGTGVCRLAIMATAAHKKENVRLLRLKDEVLDAERKAGEAASIGERFLLRGYSRKGALGVEWTWLQNPERAEIFCSQLVARAYEDAGQRLAANKMSHEAGPGDLEHSELLKDVTGQAIFEVRANEPPSYFLDDHTHFERPHHWEVATKLKILASPRVKKAILRLNEHPASFWELEGVLARLKAPLLDAAISSGFQEHKFAESFIEKTQRFVDFDANDMSIKPEQPLDLAAFNDAALLVTLHQGRQIVTQLENDVEHRQRECDLYRELEQQTQLRSFHYLGDLQCKLLQLAKNALRAKSAELLMLASGARERGLI